MVGESNSTGVASRGVEWWPEVVGCSGSAAELGWSRREVMTSGTHLSAGHKEGRRRHEVRRFLAREAAIGQGATDVRSAGPTERPRPSGESESSRLGKEKGSGPRLGRKSELGPIQVIKSF
jgi:hypothetical protein